MQIGIIGLGRLGGSLQRALSQLPAIELITGSDAEKAKLLLLCVPDDAIVKVAATLTPQPGAVVAHCSGALGSAVLAFADGEKGIHRGSFHPLQTFPDAESGPKRLKGCPVFIEGDEQAIEALTQLAKVLSAKPQTISAENKVRYHAAAVMACNQLCALLDVAFEVGSEAGVDDPNVFLPLIRATLDNIETLGTRKALTGPVVRGDHETVAAHLKALDGGKADVYRCLSRRAVEMADLSPSEKARLLKLLDSRPS